MSLTSELAQPASPISQLFSRELPDVAEIAAQYSHWASRLRRPVYPPTRGPVAWPILGHTIDHRIRVTLGHPHGTPIRAGVAFFTGLFQEKVTLVHTALHTAGRELLAELETFTSPPLLLPGPDGERLIRLCFVASHYERMFRSGDLAESDLLSQATADTNLQMLLDQVPDYALGDVTAQLRLADHEDALGWMVGQSGTCGPVFAGSNDVGGADADFIYGGELIDCKATVKPQRLGTREIYQLAGYLLLDYTDQYGIRALSLYLSRQGATITWGVTEFLARLGATRPLEELRETVRTTLTAAAAADRRR